MVELQQEILYREDLNGGWSLAWYGMVRGAAAKIKNGDFVSKSGDRYIDAGRLHLLFNLGGQGLIMGERTRLSIAPGTLAMCYPRSQVSASRMPDTGNHEFILLSLSTEWLQKNLGERSQSIYQSLRKFLVGDDDSGKPMGHIRSMSLAEKDMAQQLYEPPVEEAALPFWYSAKVREIIALHLFRPPGGQHSAVEEPFCVSRKRIAQERVDKVTEWMDEHLEEALNLKELACHVGCAPHYLSRLFSKETGRTLSQHLRALRIDKAAVLMDSGRFNVTEAAFEVGYNSLSHFTKAFVIEKGIKPSEYLLRGI